MSISIEDLSNSQPRFVYFITRPYFQVILTAIALIVIILFGSFVYLYSPYSGMEISWNAKFGQVSVVFPGGPADQAGVFEGDSLISIDGKPLMQWSDSPAYRFGIRSGDIVVFEFRRGQETLRIPITIGNYLENWKWYWYSFLIHFLAISFWILGAAMCLFSSHNDIRSRLLGLGFLMAGMTAAVGLASGFNSFWGANDLGIILRTWLGPVYVAAHLTFPTVSFPKYRGLIINIFAFVAAVLTTFVMINTLVSAPDELAVSGLGNIDLRRAAQVFFFFSWLMGTCLLVYNHIYSQDMEVKRQSAIVLWGSLLGFSPFFIFVILPNILFQEQFTGNLVSLAFLLLVPLSYIYVIHQRKLLRVDLIVNRFVVLFVLALLVMIISILVLGVLALVFDLSPELPFWGGVVAALVVLPSAALQRTVQIRVNRVLYGSYYDFSTVTADFSSRLAVTLDRDMLFELLTRDLSKQMGIRQSSLFLADGENLALQSADTKKSSIPMDDDVCRYLLEVRNPVRNQYLWKAVPESSQLHWRDYDWGELFVPVVFEGQLHGIMILGERVSADVYSDTDLQIIATIAYQGALAFKNVQLVETLRGLTQRLVRADEDQRKKLARDLHDSVLQDLFFVRQQLTSDQNELAGHISNIINQLRQTIKAQRTAMLDQGLQLALESLVMDMQSLTGENPRISWSNPLNEILKLTDEQATSIYRIVQEAISNSIKHADADHIEVRMERYPNDVLMVSVKDDGIGISETDQGTTREGHYGIIGMKERALMIGASLNIVSTSTTGTTVMLETII